MQTSRNLWIAVAGLGLLAHAVPSHGRLLDAGAPESAERWGTLTGRFVYDGIAPTPVQINANRDPEVCGKQILHDESLEVAADGGLKSAVIFLRTADVPVAPSYADSATAHVVLDNKHCRFEPHVVLLRTTQQLVVRNSDPIGHQAKLDPLKNPQINPIVPAGKEIKQSFPAEENLPAKMLCNIHPWQFAWVLIRKSPYMAVSDKDGKFEIRDLPVGQELEFGLWQERIGQLKSASISGVEVSHKGRFKIKIHAGENPLGDIKLAAESFK